MATCPNGHDNPEGQHFCGECGAPLVASSVGKSPTPTTGHPSGKREHIQSPQRGDESKSVTRPDKSAAELLALAEAEAEVAQAEAAAAAAHARVVRAMNTAASGTQPVAKRSTRKPRQQPPRKRPVRTMAGGPAVKKRKVWPWVLLGVLVLFFGGCTVLVLIGGVSEKWKPVLDKNGTYYHVNAGTDGTYETQGSNRSPNANGVIRPCTWTRLRAPDDTIENTIEMGKVEANETGRVTLESGEYFVFYGCHPWHYVG